MTWLSVATTVAPTAAPRTGTPAPEPPTTTSSSPRTVIALGGPVVMHSQALDRIAQHTGVQPTRVGGTDRYDTAARLSRRAHPDSADTVLIASGQDFPDALAAAPLATRPGTTLLLVGSDVVPEVVAEELVRLAPQAVTVLGGAAAVSPQVVDRLARLTGVTPSRLAGVDRYTTAAAISRAAHPEPTDTVYLATGQQWADALAAAPAVDARDGALLLTRPDGLPDATNAELRRLAPEQVYVLGGAAAVGDPVLAAVRSTTGLHPQRLAGPDRYATAQAIDRHARPGGAATVYAATGLDWPDALAAGPAVAADDAALTLVDTTVHWPAPDTAAAIGAAAGREGHVSFAVIGTDGTMTGHDPQRTVAAASTLKVMFLAAYLRQPTVADRALTAADRALLEPMITASANDPATTIADLLGAAPLHHLAAEAGMQDFAYTRPWGNTRTSARDQARLLWRLADLLPDRHRDYALDLLTRVVPDQRWGIGQLDLPGWQVGFKGGWGSATGSVDHQVVRLQRREGTTVAAAVMTTANPSHAYATDTLRTVFAALLHTLP